MARIAGVELPNQKRTVIALTYIYGVGSSRAKQLCTKANVNADTRVRDLAEDDVLRLREAIRPLKIEGDLRREITQSIRRLQEISSYRGVRHKKNLPVRGQRTRTNARTKRGKRQTVANKKKETK
jgi:small subunit ribosomal protein S13